MDIKELKIIFLHGNGNSTPKDNWFPFIKTELEKFGINIIDRQFPDAYLARASYWLSFLKDELKADKNSILIGHSSGAVASMRFAENNQIFGSILVAPMHTDLGIETERLSGYYDKPWDWHAIRNNQNWIIQFSSTDDPWIPIAEPRFVHEQLKSEYYEFNTQGHFGGDYHKRSFPELAEALKKKLSIITKNDYE